MSIQGKLRRPSSNDVLLALFPKIEDQLLNVILKFSLEVEDFTDKKTQKIAVPDKKVSTVLERFPRAVTGYKKAVDRLVDFGKYSVVDAINLLFTFLPTMPNNKLYTNFTGKIPNFHVQKDIWNDFIMLFFADCTAQLLSKQDDVPCYNQIIQFGYQLLNPTNNQVREHLRLLTVRQFSVIFGFISIKHLDIFLNGFANNLNNGDITSCFLLHRFLRLTPSKTITISMIEAFFKQWSSAIKQFKKNVAVHNIWAYSLRFLTAQIRTEGFPELSDIMSSLYDYAIARIKDGEADPSFYALAGTILMRDDKIFSKNYDKFIERRIIAKAKKYPEATLTGFLMILRGSYISRSALFWEWGSFHNNDRPGVEASQIYLPEQEQNNNPNSFTQILFNNFLTIPGIEKYTKLLGDILVNLAARNFSFFAKDTVPAYIQKLGLNSLNSLSEALLQISAPEYHFEEWISEHKINQGKKIAPEIRALFMQIKSALFSFIDQLKPLGEIKRAYWFKLDEQFSTPVFSLPMETIQLSSEMAYRITESTNTSRNILSQWGFNDTASELTLKFETTQVESVTPEELVHLRLLTFFPHIITFGDLQTNSFSKRMKNYIISSSVCVALFAIQMLCHLYSANSSYRLSILDMILTWLSDTSEPVHLFIILELFVRLFDLSLKPSAQPKPGCDVQVNENCPINDIQKFADRAQATIIYLLAQPFPELRDLVVAAIERLSKYANALKVSIPLEHILTDFDISISTAVSYKANAYEAENLPVSPTIPNQQIPFRVAASSKFNHFFSYYIPEIIASFSHKFSPTIIEYLANISIAAMKRLGNNPVLLDQEYLNIYQNYAIIISNTVPMIDHSMYKLLYTQFPLEYASFHNYLITSDLSDEKVRIKLSPISQTINSQLSKILNCISNDPDALVKNEKIIRCFSMMRWQTAATFAPIFLEWIQNAKIDENIHSLIAALKILKCFAQNPDFKFTLSSQPVYLTLFSTLVEQVRNTIKDEYINEKTLVAQPLYKQLLHAYINAVFFFITSITIDLEERTEGAFRIPTSFSWINDFVSIAFDMIKFCEIVTKLRSGKDREVTLIGEKSSRCIASIIASCAVLNLAKEKEVALYESICFETQVKGWPTLHFALHRNFKQLINAFITHSYDSIPETSRIYFKAIVSTLLPDSDHLIDNTKLSHKSEDKRTQMILNTMMYTMNTRSNLLSQYQTVDNEQLTAFERVYNRDVLNACGRIMFLAFLYLMDDVFEMRSSAFSLVMRMVPFALAICEAHDPVKAGEAVKKLGKYSALFNSSVMTVSQSIIKKICGIVAQYVPQISEQIIKEAIKCLKVSVPTSFAFNINQSAIIDIIIISLQNVQITNQIVLSEISSRFAVYTPYSLLCELLYLYKYIKHSGRSTYLNIWTKISTTPDSVETIVDFLLAAAKDQKQATAIQSILLFIAQNHTDIVISALASRISFSFWFYQNVQLSINNSKPPVFSFTMFNAILSTLIELAQIVPSQLVSYLHLIIHFAFIYYDYAPTQCCTLLFILMSGLNTCPDNITNAFLPPGLLTWDLENCPRVSAQAKQPILATTIAMRIIEYFKSQKAKRVLTAWGKEAVAWATGCGDLKIASRSAAIFSCLLQPVDGVVIVSLIRNAHHVAKCQQSPQSTEYLMSIFNLLSAIIDRYVSKPDFNDSFTYIFTTAQQFVSFTQNPSLARAALAIVAKYVMNGQTTYDQMKDLIAVFTDLMANLNDRRTVDGAFMACLKMKNPPSDISGTSIEQLAFLAYIPRIYSALASCHNIEPYLTEVGEMEARRILQCALLIARTDLLPQQLSIYFLQSLSNPNTTTLVEFALKCAAHLTQGSLQPIIDAAPLWECYANGKNSALREAVFSLVYAFIGIDDFCSGADAFSPIVALAANSSSEASSNLLERFMKLSSEQSVPIAKAKYNFPEHHWSDVPKLLDEIDNEDIKLPEGESDLSDCLLLAVPTMETMWDHKNYAELKKQLAKIKVKPFTVRYSRIDELKAEVSRDDSQRLVISQDAQDYLEYLNYMN